MCAKEKWLWWWFSGFRVEPFIFFQLLVLDDLCDLPYFETWSSHYLKNTARAGVSWLMPALPVHRWCCYFLRFPTPTKEDTASEHMPLPRLQSSFYDPTTSNFFFFPEHICFAMTTFLFLELLPPRLSLGNWHTMPHKLEIRRLFWSWTWCGVP